MIKTNESRPPVRWWPAAATVALAAGLFVFNALRDTRHLQTKVIFTFPVLFATAVLLFLWAVFFSRLPGRTRLAVFLAVAVLTIAGFSLFRIVGVDGNLVPILGFRWSGERSYGVAAESAGVIQPGPDDYPQFYGPRRDATLPGPRLVRDWEARPPKELWRHPVGEGWSSFAVVGAAAVTQEKRGDDEVVVRYELLTGEEVWVHTEGTSFVSTIGGEGPRATPTIAEGRVYALGSTGVLSCLELAGGELVWSTDVLEDNDARLPEWGLSSSPLVAGDLLVLQLGKGNTTALVAYDRAGGERVWRSGEDEDPGSYTSPILATLAGVEQVVVVNLTSVAGHDPATGRMLWRTPWPTDGERVTPPLLLGDDRLLVSAGYGVGSRLLQLFATDGKLTVEELWEGRRLKSKFAPMVLHEGTVYGLDDGVLVAIDPATGERRWKRGRYGHGQMILVGGVLLIQTEKGDVVLVEANPGEHRELGRIAALSSKTWNPPALSGRYLLVRNNREAVCYELAVEGSSS